MTVNSKTPIDDLSRARINGFKVGMFLNLLKYFTALEDLINLVEAYRGRKYNEDIEYLDKKLGGIIKKSIYFLRHPWFVRISQD